MVMDTSIRSGENRIQFPPRAHQVTKLAINSCRQLLKMFWNRSSINFQAVISTLAKYNSRRLNRPHFYQLSQVSGIRRWTMWALFAVQSPDF
jgi:hypothetical protein